MTLKQIGFIFTVWNHNRYYIFNLNTLDMLNIYLFICHGINFNYIVVIHNITHKLIFQLFICLNVLVIIHSTLKLICV